jgi:hypothetical protein
VYNGQPKRKNNRKKGLCWFDWGKKINGRKRHVLVDHLGLIIAGAVGAASRTDRDGLDALCYLSRNKTVMPKKVYADLEYIPFVTEKSF